MYKYLIIGCLSLCFLLLTQCSKLKEERIIMTVNGPIAAESSGRFLAHEHVLVDFIGADSTSADRWDKAGVVEVVLPYLQEVQEKGVNTFVDCTPAFIGRDPIILKALSDSTGLNLVTNTGLYGAVDNKFIPSYVYEATAEQLAAGWIDEFEHGIEGTGIRPGFIKIGVNPGALSGLHRKLITAAGLTHKQTGLTIASHTGPAIPAFEQLETLAAMGVDGDAFIWVHAQNEPDFTQHTKAAQMGAWISLDGYSVEQAENYLAMINNLRDNGLLPKLLVSHDAGWYSPGEDEGGEFRRYTEVFTSLIPLLRENNYSQEEIDQIFVLNPQHALAIVGHK